MVKNILRSLASFLLVGILMPYLALADGMVIWPDEYDPNRWRYRDENSQLAFINYKDGLQKMILSIGLEQANGNGVWLFPVPAKPEKVVIDIVDTFPDWYGINVLDGAKNSLEDVFMGLKASQIYPALLTPFRMGRAVPMYSEGINSLGAASAATAKQDVVVYEHLDKDGIATEIITAQTSFGLYDYLKNKGLNVAEGSIPVMSSYIGKDYTFIVSWITENIETTQVQPLNGDSLEMIYPEPPSPYYNYNRGVFVAFPTDKIYYPLMPTSVYQSKVIPTTIKISGFVNPKVFKDIEPYTKTQYFFDDYYSYSSSPKIFYNEPNKTSLKYTVINIDAPSKMLSEDLFVNDSGPASASYAYFVFRHPIILFIIIMLILSAITGLIAGLITFKEARSIKGLWKFSLLGLSNCLTIVGVIIATASTPTKNIKPEDRDLFEAIKRRGYRVGGFRVMDWRKFIFIPVFSIIFMLLSWAIISILKLPL